MFDIWEREVNIKTTEVNARRRKRRRTTETDEAEADGDGDIVEYKAPGIDDFVNAWSDLLAVFVWITCWNKTWSYCIFNLDSKDWMPLHHTGIWSKSSSLVSHLYELVRRTFRCNDKQPPANFSIDYLIYCGGKIQSRMVAYKVTDRTPNSRDYPVPNRRYRCAVRILDDVLLNIEVEGKEQYIWPSTVQPEDWTWGVANIEYDPTVVRWLNEGTMRDREMVKKLFPRWYSNTVVRMHGNVYHHALNTTIILASLTLDAIQNKSIVSLYSPACDAGKSGYMYYISSTFGVTRIGRVTKSPHFASTKACDGRPKPGLAGTNLCFMSISDEAKPGDKIDPEASLKYSAGTGQGTDERTVYAGTERDNFTNHVNSSNVTIKCPNSNVASRCIVPTFFSRTLKPREYEKWIVSERHHQWKRELSSKYETTDTLPEDRVVLAHKASAVEASALTQNKECTSQLGYAFIGAYLTAQREFHLTGAEAGDTIDLMHYNCSDWFLMHVAKTPISFITEMLTELFYEEPTHESVLFALPDLPLNPTPEQTRSWRMIRPTLDLSQAKQGRPPRPVITVQELYDMYTKLHTQKEDSSSLQDAYHFTSQLKKTLETTTKLHVQKRQGEDLVIGLRKKKWRKP